MPQLDLFKQDGTKVGAVEANEAVFGIEPNQHVLFQAVTLQRASLRQGTHKTKGRSEVSGGGRKPWRHKGTGRAREVFALETLAFDTIKTKNFKEMLSNLSLEKKVLFVVTELEENTVLSGRNIPGVEFVETTGLNVLDILGSNKVVFTKDALEKVGEVLA